MVLFFVGLCVFTYAQNELPSTKIKSIKGEEVSFNSLMAARDTVIIVSFWATWCIPCIAELETFKDQYDERQKETPFRIIAVSIDDSRTSSRVKPFVKGRGWNFDIYLDVNNDLKRALNINDVPHVLVIKNGKIIYQHNGYVIGDEEELFSKIRAN
jgi:cytochrome c biogenesis protein CcmG/thiol:disulfide interchange protein DsbE